MSPSNVEPEADRQKISSNAEILSSFNAKVKAEAVDETEQDCEMITSNEEILKALTPIPEFETRDEIKPWVFEKLHKRGINLVIERSDSSKVVFKCKTLNKKSFSSALARSNMVVSRHSPAPAPAPKDRKKSRQSSKKLSHPEENCPFRLRVSHSVKNDVWTVLLAKEEHNPLVCCNFGDPVLQAQFNIASSPNCKRSYSAATNSYTPASTVSPTFSSTMSNSPATSIFTPTSETFDSEYTLPIKRQKSYISRNMDYTVSPLFHEDFDQFNASLSHGIDEQEQFYETSKDRALLNSIPIQEFDSQMEFSLLDPEAEQFSSALDDLPGDANIMLDTSANSGNNINRSRNSLNLVLDEFDHGIDVQQFPNRLTPILENNDDMNEDILSPPTSDLDIFFHQHHSQTPQQQSQTPQYHQNDQSLKQNVPLSPYESMNLYHQRQLQELHHQLQSSTASLHQNRLKGQQFPQDQSPQLREVSILNLRAGMKNMDDGENTDLDPLMYLLNTASATNNNPNYTLEELENLDKAMALDDNDTYLMSMFQGM